MPPNLVKPGLEKYWTKAKELAEAQGHGGDYAYIVGIFKKMTMNKSEAMAKGGPYLGKRGGKWADPEHTIPWKPSTPGHRMWHETAWDDLAAPLRQWIHRPTEGKVALLNAWRGLPDRAKQALQSEVEHAVLKEHKAPTFKAYRRVKELDAEWGGASVTTGRENLGAAGDVVEVEIDAKDVLLHWAQGGPLGGAFAHEKEVVLKPGAKPKVLRRGKAEELKKADLRTSPVLHVISRWPGQVPDRKGLEANLMLRRVNAWSTPRPDPQVTQIVPTAQHAVSNLGLDYRTEGEWVRFLENLVFPNVAEVRVRHAVLEKMMADRMDPALRGVMWSRISAYVKHVCRGDETLQKAGPIAIGKRGGKIYGYTTDRKPIYSQAEARAYMQKLQEQPRPKRQGVETKPYRGPLDLSMDLSAAEAAIATEKVEHGAIFDTAGNMVLRMRGTASRLKMTPDHVDQIRKVEGGAVLTHNHPGAMGFFSAGDLYFVMKVDIRQMRAVGGDGVAWSVTRPKDGWAPGYQGDLEASRHIQRAYFDGMKIARAEWEAFINTPEGAAEYRADIPAAKRKWHGMQETAIVEQLRERLGPKGWRFEQHKPKTDAETKPAKAKAKAKRPARPKRERVSKPEGDASKRGGAGRGSTPKQQPPKPAKPPRPGSQLALFSADPARKSMALVLDLQKAAGHKYLRRWKGKDGKWEYDYGVLGKKPPRTGTLDIDNQEIHNITNELLMASPATNGVIEGKLRFNSVKRQFRNAAGDTVPVTVTLIPSAGMGNPKNIKGGASPAVMYEGSGKGKLQSVSVTIKVASVAGQQRNDLAKRIRDVLSHELMHALDPSITRKAERANASAAYAANAKEEARKQGRTYAGYLNLKREVTASLQQIVRDLRDKPVVAELQAEAQAHFFDPDMPPPMRPIELLKYHSPRWAMVSEHYTPENRKRILKAVAQLREGILATTVKPITKSQSTALVLDELIKAAAKGGKYIRRVPYTDRHGKTRYRYFYRESAAARSAQEGEEIKLGDRVGKVLSVSERGAVTIELDGSPQTFPADEWHRELTKHYGEQFEKSAEKRARQTVNAVLRHVPSHLLQDLKGETDAQRLAELKTRVPAVYAKLEKAFKRAGMTPFQAKQILSKTLERRGWEPEARAAAVGTVLTHRGTSITRLIDTAENLAGGAKVGAKHVAAATELGGAGRGEPLSEIKKIAAQAERDVAKLTQMLAGLQEGKTNAAELFAEAMASKAIQKLNLLAQAFPGLADRAVRPTQDILPQVAAETPKKPTREGADTVVYVAGEGGKPKALKARYRLVEAGDMVASHKPDTFTQREDYPAGVQERAYHRDKSEQAKVIRNAQRMDPRFVVNTNPDAVNGPPMVTSDGIVLGGNSRAMSMQRIYSQHPDKATEMRQYLEDHAHEVGFKPSDVKAMKNPVLIREVDVEDKSKRSLQVLVRQMNESFTQAMDPRTMQVAMGRRLDVDTLKTLANDLGEDETLAAFLGSKRSERFVNALHRSGIIDDRNANQYTIKGTRQLNQDGVQLVSRILVGRTVQDADVLSNTGHQMIEAVARAIPALTQATAHGEGFDLGGDMAVAIDAFNSLNQKVGSGVIRNLDPKMPGKDFADLFNHFRTLPGIAEPHPVLQNERATTLLELLVRRRGPVQMAKFAKAYAAEAAKNPEGQSTMFGAAKTPAQVLTSVVNQALDRKPTGPDEQLAASFVLVPEGEDILGKSYVLVNGQIRRLVG